jgi:hypothetical protein
MNMMMTAITALLVSVILVSAGASFLMYVRIKALRREIERMKPDAISGEEMDRIEESLSGDDTLPSD